MRIVHVAHGWPTPGTGSAGGTERYAAALVEAQCALGADAVGFTPADVPATRRPRGFTASWRSAAAEAAFTRMLDRHGADVVHFHHLSGLSLDLGPLARRAGAWTVLTLHDAWLDCARGQLVDDSGAPCPGPDARRCARCLAPALYAPLPGVTRLPPRLGPVHARREAVDRFFASMDLVLSPSHHLGPRLGRAARYLPLPLLSPPLPRPPRTDGAVRLLYAGALLPTKGPDIAVEAFARLPRGAATLAVVGPAPPYRGTRRYADQLRRRAAEIPGVRLHEAQPPEGMAARYASADVLVFPSTWMENSPFVLREALAAGLRIVASDVPGAREVAPHASFVPPGDVAALAAALAVEVRQAPLVQTPNPSPPAQTLAEHAHTLLQLYRR